MHGTVFFLSANGEIYSMSRGDSKSVVLRGLSSALAEEVNAPTKLAGSLTGVTICGFAGGGEYVNARPFDFLWVPLLPFTFIA